MSNGALREYDCSSGERKNLEIRRDSQFSNRKSVSSQIMRREIIKLTLFSLLSGAQFLPVEKLAAKVGSSINM